LFEGAVKVAPKKLLLARTFEVELVTNPIFNFQGRSWKTDTSLDRSLAFITMDTKELITLKKPIIPITTFWIHSIAFQTLKCF
jgi:hypothetical protein